MAMQSTQSRYGHSHKKAIALIAVDIKRGLIHLPQTPIDAPLHGGYYQLPMADLDGDLSPQARAQSLMPAGFQGDASQGDNFQWVGTYESPPYTPHRRQIVVVLQWGQIQNAAANPPQWFAPAGLLAAWQRGEMAIEPLALRLIQGVTSLQRDGQSTSTGQSQKAAWANALMALGETLQGGLEQGLNQGLIHHSPGLDMLPLLSPTLPPATHTNAYLLGDERFIVVDPASPHADEHARLTAIIDARLKKGHELAGIFLTHHHPDHIAGAHPLHRRYGAPIMAHALTKARLDGAFPVHHLLDEGDSLALGSLRAQVLHTPGHAPGHLCLFLPQSRCLIAGDMIAGWGTIVIESTDGDLGAYLRQLTRLAALKPRMVMPAHGPALADGAAVLEQFRDHRLHREAQILALLQNAPAGLSDITRAIYPDLPAHILPIAEAAMEAHLIKLMQERRITHLPDGKIRLI